MTQWATPAGTPLGVGGVIGTQLLVEARKDHREPVREARRQIPWVASVMV